MSLYAEGQKVYVKSLGVVATVIQANWQRVGSTRRASYLVQERPGTDYLTGSDDLRAADWECEGCGRHWSGSPYIVQDTFRQGGDDIFYFCFLCEKEQERRPVPDMDGI